MKWPSERLRAEPRLSCVSKGKGKRKFSAQFTFDLHGNSVENHAFDSTLFTLS